MRCVDSRGAHAAVSRDASRDIQRFSDKYHTTTPELAELASKAKPRLLILYHHSTVSPEDLMNEMLSRYAGHFVIGRDLDVY